jgi:hypothetical protein
MSNNTHLCHLNFPKRQTFVSSHVVLRKFLFLAWREILSEGGAKNVQPVRALLSVAEVQATVWKRLLISTTRGVNKDSVMMMPIMIHESCAS